MLFVIGSSSELLGLSSSLELWFCVLFRSFWVVLVNFPVGRFTRTIISVSLVHVSVVSVDNPSLPCTPVHVLPPFCGRDGVLGCSRPRFAPFCGRGVVPICSRPRKCPFCGRDAEGGLAIPSSAPRRGWCGRRGGSARGRPGVRWRRREQWRGPRTSPSRGWWLGRTRSAS